VEPIRISVQVNTSLKEAFAAFTEEFGCWWPSAYTLSKETLDTVGIEPREGGFCYEIGPHGFRCDWGRVKTWNPPHSIAFLWQVSPNSAPDPNPDHASEVQVRFTPLKDGQTLVELDHVNMERHGEGSSEYREEFASEYGWSYLLLQYQAHVNGA